MPIVPSARRGGVTLVELVLVLSILALLAAVAIPRLATFTGRLALRAGVYEVRTALAIGREQAVRRGEFVAFVGDAARGRVRVVSGNDTLYSRDLGARGIALALTRDSITWAPTGEGWGAANTTITLARRGMVDTITVSRLGRVR